MSIIIVGGGITGVTLALAVSKLTHGQLPVHLIEATALDTCSHPGFDARSIALAHGTCQHLARIGIWQELAEFVTAINTIHISDHEHSCFITIEAQDYHIDALGLVIELRYAGSQLLQLLKSAAGVNIYCPATVESFIRTEKEVRVTLNNSTKLIGQLLVAADGSQSSIGTACGITWYQKSYGQAAVIANISTSITNIGRAFERFTNHGPLAILPTSHGRSSIVWCHLIEKINEVLAWSDDRFCDELQKEFGWHLGRITHASKRSSYLLNLITASRFISHRTVLVGNAAQTLHPIIGQGFNLGIRDVISLAEIVAQSWVEHKDCGTWPLLCRYQTRRQNDKEITVFLTDSLVTLFSNRYIPLVIGRNFMLKLLKLFHPARNLLIQRTLGWVLR